MFLLIALVPSYTLLAAPGSSMSRLDRDPWEVLAAFEAALAMDPLRVEAHANRGPRGDVSRPQHAIRKRSSG